MRMRWVTREASGRESREDVSVAGGACGWRCAAERGMQPSGGGWFVLGADVRPVLVARTRAHARMYMCRKVIRR